MTKVPEFFPLPGTGYPQLTAIIKAYYMCHEEYISTKGLNEYLLNKISTTDIARNSKFLVEMDIIEDVKVSGSTKNFKLTEIGSKLGSAIERNDNIEISKIWRFLVEGRPFFEKVLSTIKFSGHVEKSRIKKFIVSASGKEVTRHRFDLNAVTILQILEQANLIEAARKFVQIKNKTPENTFINTDIILTLEGIKSVFDCSRLIRYCEEINDNYKRGNYASVGFLARAIVDHIPPIFNQKSFASLAAQVSGERHPSFKKSCEALDRSLKHIVDRSIHKQINAADIPPFKEEINFAQDLNTVLARVIEELKTTWKEQ